MYVCVFVYTPSTTCSSATVQVIQFASRPRQDEGTDITLPRDDCTLIGSDFTQAKGLSLKVLTPDAFSAMWEQQRKASAVIMQATQTRLPCQANGWCWIYALANALGCTVYTTVRLQQGTKKPKGRPPLLTDAVAWDNILCKKILAYLKTSLTREEKEMAAFKVRTDTSKLLRRTY